MQADFERQLQERDDVRNAELEKQRKKIKDDWAEYCQKSFSTIDEIKEAVDEYEGNKNTKLITALSAALEKDFPDFPVLDEDTFKNSSTEKMVSFVFTLICFTTTMAFTSPYINRN